MRSKPHQFVIVKKVLNKLPFCISASPLAPCKHACKTSVGVSFISAPVQDSLCVLLATQDILNYEEYIYCALYVACMLLLFIIAEIKSFPQWQFSIWRCAAPRADHWNNMEFALKSQPQGTVVLSRLQLHSK